MKTGLEECMEQEINRLKEQNAELLEAIKTHLNPLSDSMKAHKMMIKAIAKAEATR